MPTSSVTISICIPAYNAAHFLPQTLESVRAQTFPDWELIVVEDGSDDGTASLTDSFSSQVPQPVRYIRHPKNRGLPVARNTAIEAAQGIWIALLDADDLWTPDHLGKLIDAADDQTGLYHSVSLLFEGDAENILMKRVPPESGFPLETLFAGRYIIQPSSVLLHRLLLSDVGDFDPNFRNGLGEDIDYWIRVARAGYPVVCNGAMTCLYRKHSSALSAQSALLVEGTANVRLKHLDAPVFSQAGRKAIAARFFRAAARMNVRSDPERARKLYLKAWILQPVQLLALACFIMTTLIALGRHLPRCLHSFKSKP